ncbi:hypothetical protein TNCV_117751 [Trichonephila clavipes]|nr:hypothetical protein TNCV_117751 [Trichonephila clavipes]
MSSKKMAVGSLVVRASDSRSEGLGLMPLPPNTVRVHMDYVLVQSVVPCLNLGVDIGGVAIYRSFGKFSKLNHIVTSMVAKANDRRTSIPFPR